MTTHARTSDGSVRLTEEVARIIYDHQVAEAERQIRRWTNIRNMTADRYLRSEGLFVHTAPDVIAGRMAKAGWMSLRFRPGDDTPESGMWRAYGHAGDFDVDPDEIAAVLCPKTEAP